MRTLLLLIVAILTASDVLSLDLSLGPGLSVKNALLNVVAFALIIRIVLKGDFKLEIPTIVTCFGIMFFYALLSSFVATWIVEYPHYNLLGGIVGLKATLVDQTMLCLTFFYATRTESDVRVITRMLLICIGIANLITITNVYGLTDIGNLMLGNDDNVEGGRVYGVFGHANETGVLIAVFIPAYVAGILNSKGLWRLALGASMLASVVMFVMTASRSGLAALFLGGIWGMVLCRNVIAPGRIIRGAAVGAALALPVIALVAAKYGGLFIQRLLSQSSSADIGDVSSGRTTLWAEAIGRMMETPLSLITGFGWNVYDSMGFTLIPHNYYIMLWFELGLVGLICFVLIFRSAFASILAAARHASPGLQLQLIACAFSIVILMVGLFVDQLFKPWLYIWPYFAVTLRASFLVGTPLREHTGEILGRTGKPMSTAVSKSPALGRLQTPSTGKSREGTMRNSHANATTPGGEKVP